ncbi:ABC transporter permease [Butyrivibrio sp. M55]|uniref:ABC transporter permease n=1 Tax=Butyrivibrio sp. M55 TaxID=1855323 RepID=UPI0008E621E6|nr:FtsX-like permease family protein [Butyrivibrio sp. M55]SFU47709.1 FtsX-like permease family protein [Butyrivibrio sp. M55]
MGVILKHTFRNIFAKPLMTVFLVVSITICAFAGMMAFDMSNSIENIFIGVFNTLCGTSNVIVESPDDIDENNFEGLPDFEATYISSKASKVTVRNDQMYAFYNQKNLNISGVDTGIASKMRLIPKDIALGADEIIIDEVMAKELDLKEGDMFKVYGDNDVDVEFKIKRIAKLKGLLLKEYSAVVSDEGMARLCYNGIPKHKTAYIKVQDKSKVGEFCNAIEERFPNYEVEDLLGGRQTQDQIKMISSIFKILFLITLILVIFVTVTLSERIMRDRMSTIGTLRSLGVSPGITARIILIENMFYGLFGGLIGTGLYVASRDAIFNAIFIVSAEGTDMNMDLGQVSIPVMIAVIIGSVMVEMLCPLRELFKATGTAIRDIIFDNKDTEYKYKNKNKVLSIIFASLAGVMTVLMFTVYKDSAVVGVLGFIFMVFSLFCGYPFLLRMVSKIIERISLKSKNPVLGLAATNLRTNKTSIGSSKLAFIATSICLVLFIFITSEKKEIEIPPADADVILRGLSEGTGSYDYIETLDGVNKIEYDYSRKDKVLFGKEKIEDYQENKYNRKFDDEFEAISIFGTEGNPELNHGYIGLPDVINGDEIYIAKNIAKEQKLKVGDNADILLDAKGVVPYRGTFKVAGIIDSSIADDSNKTIVLPLDLYKQIYLDRPENAYIKTDNPEKTAELIKSYSSSTINKVNTMDEYMKEIKDDAAGVLTLYYMIIIIGASMSLVGIYSNQIVGFESRKRESAVLVSTAMSKDNLTKLFFEETVLSGIIAIGIGTIIGSAETLFIYKAMNALSETKMFINFGQTAVFLLVIFFTFSITVLKTMRDINKMKIAEQLKYE